MPVVLFVFWLVVAAALLVFVAPVAFTVTFAGATLVAVGTYFRRAARVLLPDRAEGPSPVRQPSEEPAFRHYLVSQVWRDWRAVLNSAVPEITGLAGSALDATTQGLMRGARGFFLFPVWLAVCAGIVIATVPLAVLGLLVTAVYAGTVAAGLLVWLSGVAVLRGVEQVLMSVRRILQACPYPGCYEKFTLPAYACPGCGARHRRLTPNLDGAARHACRCGARLPTTILLGRHRLKAHCPHCDRLLPGGVGRVRVEPLPLVGGPDAGKTTFMALAVDALSSAVARAGGTAQFVDEGDEVAFQQLLRQLREGHVIKTGTQLPKAVILDLKVPAGQRLLYLFDPSGEHYTGASRVEAMSYLAHGETMLLVIDPFALPAVQDALVGADRELLTRERLALSREDPADTVHRVRNELSARADGGRQRRVAVVVTKADVLRRTASGDGVDDDPAAWLSKMGMGNLVRDLTGRAAEVRYATSGKNAPPDEIAGLLGWLVGLRLNGAGASGSTVIATAPQRAWTGRPRPEGRPPLSYTVARRVIYGTTTLLSAAAVALLGTGIWMLGWIRLPVG